MRRPLLCATHNGERASLIEWARRAGVSPDVMRVRAKLLGASVAVARSLAQPGIWPRVSRKRSSRPFARCKADGCQRSARTEGLCFKHFCAAVRT